MLPLLLLSPSVDCSVLPFCFIISTLLDVIVLGYIWLNHTVKVHLFSTACFVQYNIAFVVILRDYESTYNMKHEGHWKYILMYICIYVCIYAIGQDKVSVVLGDDGSLGNSRQEIKQIHGPTSNNQRQWSQRQGCRQGYSVAWKAIQETRLQTDYLQHTSGNVRMLRPELNRHLDSQVVCALGSAELIHEADQGK